eukprot:2198071-Amphidinium_carterae.1
MFSTGWVLWAHGSYFAPITSNSPRERRCPTSACIARVVVAGAEAVGAQTEQTLTGLMKRKHLVAAGGHNTKTQSYTPILVRVAVIIIVGIPVGSLSCHIAAYGPASCIAGEGSNVNDVNQ